MDGRHLIAGNGDQGTEPGVSADSSTPLGAYGRDMDVTHLGHACLLVDCAGERLLIDPGTFSDTWYDLTDLSAVLITHQHPDHVDVQRLPALLERNPGVPVITDPGTSTILAEAGVEASVHTGSPVAIGAATVRPVGQWHAVIYDELERITNVGVVISGPDEPSLYHAGDSLDGDPGPVDAVAFALSAPWQASKEMIDFLRRMPARIAIPIHDGLLSDIGRPVYLRQARDLGCQDRVQLLDLAGAGATTLEAAAQ